MVVAVCGESDTVMLPHGLTTLIPPLAPSCNLHCHTHILHHTRSSAHTGPAQCPHPLRVCPQWDALSPQQPPHRSGQVQHCRQYYRCQSQQRHITHRECRPLLHCCSHQPHTAVHPGHVQQQSRRPRRGPVIGADRAPCVGRHWRLDPQLSVLYTHSSP